MLEQIGELQAQVDRIQDEAEEFKKNIDILASKKEASQAQLESVETHLRDAKEKASVQVNKIEELQFQLDLAIFDKANLANELEAAKSEVAVANIKVDAKVSQFKVDVEDIQEQAKSMVDHARWQARREALEGVHARDFDIPAEIENAKAEEARARKLAFPEEDSKSLSESEGREDPEGGDAASDEDQAT
nr:keratin, type II cytoskeletal cochleal-like [Nicotiana tomentosiformis]